MTTYLFYVKEMTFLRYFIPLAQKISDYPENSKITFALGSSGKYNCPQKKHNKNAAHDLIAEHVPNARTVNIQEVKDIHDIEFVIEGLSSRKSRVVVSLAYMTDYRLSARNYVDKVDIVQLQSPYYFQYLMDHDQETAISLRESGNYEFCMSPKYLLDRRLLLNHRHKDDVYDILLYHPKIPDSTLKHTVEKLLSSHDRDLIIKTRGKHPISSPIKSSRIEIMEDESWFPHTTMQLMETAQDVYNFDSTAVEEAAIMGIMDKFHNIPVKSFTPLPKLYENKGALATKGTTFPSKVLVQRAQWILREKYGN